LLFDKAASPKTTNLIAYRDKAWFDAHLKRALEKDGWAVRDIEAAEGYWLAVLEKRKAKQKIFSADRFEDVERLLKGMWKEGYRTVLLENGNDRWYAVFEKGKRKETVTTAEDYGDFIAEIRKLWKKGYRIVDLAEARR
jgi:hypothetical protein